MARPQGRLVGSEMAAVRAGMRCSNVEAVFATIHLVLTQGIFLTNYVLDLGGSNMVCGIIEALPYTVQFTYFLSPLLVRRMRARKPVVIFFAIAHRASWLFLILLLFTHWSPGTRQVLLVLVLLLANVCAVIAGNAWYSWMADLVPPAIRGSYYGRRNTYLGVTAMITLFLGTQLLTTFRDIELGRIGYTLCYGIAIASAAYAAWMLSRQYEPPVRQIEVLSPTKVFATLRQTPLLRDFIIFFTIWQLGMGVGAAYFGVHMIKVLGLSPAEMGYLGLAGSGAALVGSRLWGRAMDRVGDRAVLIASGVIIFAHIWVWMLSTKAFLLPLWIATMAGGFAWAGFNLAVFAWPQRMASPESRQYTYGMLGMISGPAFVVGSLSGGVITTVLPQDLGAILGFPVTNFHVVFVLSALLRGIALVLIAKLSLRYDRGLRSVPRCLSDTFREMNAAAQRYMRSLKHEPPL